MEQGAIRAVVEKMQGTERTSRSLLFPPRTIWIVPRSRTDASKQIVVNSALEQGLLGEFQCRRHVGGRRLYRRYSADVRHEKGASLQWEEDIPPGNCRSSRKQPERS